MPIAGRSYSEQSEKFIIKSSVGERRYLEIPMHLVQIQGLAMPPLEHRTVRSPFQHGETYLGFSLRPRVVTVSLALRQCTRLELWQLRQDLISLINPLVGTLRIRAEFRNGTIYELHDVAYDSQFEMGTDGMTGPYTQNIAARFIAYDPVWWYYPMNQAGPSLTIVNDLVFGDVDPPSTMIFPITFGAVHIDETQNVVNSGNWMAFPVFTLTGPMYYPLIENLTTDEKLQLNYAIADGEIVTITTAFGNKTVISDLSGNLIGYLSTDSDLATFHLDPGPIATNGVNTLSFFGGNADAGSSILVQWFDRFLGL